MLRQSMIELLDRVELNPRRAECTAEPERHIEPAGKSGEHQPATAYMSAGSISRYFASSPVWSREVGYFEVGERSVATRC